MTQKNNNKENKEEINIGYQLVYDEVYLKELRDKAKKNWLNNINVDEYLKEVKGGYED
jgi:hypothetical protein